MSRWNALQFLALIAVGMTAAGCYKKEGPTEADRHALLVVDQEFARLCVEKGSAEAFHAYYAEDGVQLPPVGPPRVGRDQIYELMLRENEVKLTWTPTSADVSAGGDMGFTWGTFEIEVPRKDIFGNPVKIAGKYLNVWKKVKGVWKLAVDIGNRDPRLPLLAPPTSGEQPPAPKP